MPEITVGSHTDRGKGCVLMSVALLLLLGGVVCLGLFVSAQV